MSDSEHRQTSYRVRFDWGPSAAGALTADLLVVVDVLSFTTTLTVAADRGVPVIPCRWRDNRADALAVQYDATRAGPRGCGGVSLSPGSVRAADGLERLVLPSPNGATISAAATGPVLGVSLRNRAAASSWLGERLDDGATVVVIASGERWPDGSLRPAVEDLWGAGAVLSSFPAELLSPEARAAVAAAGPVLGDPRDALRACASGRELIAAGWGDDVDVAAELDASSALPVLCDGVFVPSISS
ncbi:2-phosphosulfolactate phosphatase [Pseudonocardia phyllosphaerae]|uniref:2-phosphosulfolactate phosphatase n=1 Tax=Pseudonocardia phyllosphaerae TaxID=3390502 RepID=UPI00397C6FAE